MFFFVVVLGVTANYIFEIHCLALYGFTNLAELVFRDLNPGLLGGKQLLSNPPFLKKV